MDCVEHCVVNGCCRNAWQCAWTAIWTLGILFLGRTASDCKKKEVVYLRTVVNLDC